MRLCVECGKPQRARSTPAAASKCCAPFAAAYGGGHHEHTAPVGLPGDGGHSSAISIGLRGPRPHAMRSGTPHEHLMLLVR
jgi:hypothetical protein